MRHRCRPFSVRPSRFASSSASEEKGRRSNSNFAAIFGWVMDQWSARTVPMSQPRILYRAQSCRSGRRVVSYLVPWGMCERIAAAVPELPGERAVAPADEDARTDDPLFEDEDRHMIFQPWRARGGTACDAGQGLAAAPQGKRAQVRLRGLASARPLTEPAEVKVRSSCRARFIAAAPRCDP